MIWLLRWSLLQLAGWCLAMFVVEAVLIWAVLRSFRPTRARVLPPGSMDPTDDEIEPVAESPAD